MCVHVLCFCCCCLLLFFVVVFVQMAGGVSLSEVQEPTANATVIELGDERINIHTLNASKSGERKLISQM